MAQGQIFVFDARGRARGDGLRRARGRADPLRRPRRHRSSPPRSTRRSAPCATSPRRSSGCSPRRRARRRSGRSRSACCSSCSRPTSSPSCSGDEWDGAMPLLQGLAASGALYYLGFSWIAFARGLGRPRPPALESVAALIVFAARRRAAAVRLRARAPTCSAWSGRRSPCWPSARTSSSGCCRRRARPAGVRARCGPGRRRRRRSAALRLALWGGERDRAPGGRRARAVPGRLRRRRRSRGERDLIRELRADRPNAPGVDPAVPRHSPEREYQSVAPLDETAANDDAGGMGAPRPTPCGFPILLVFIGGCFGVLLFLWIAFGGATPLEARRLRGPGRLPRRRLAGRAGRRPDRRRQRRQGQARRS